MQAQLTSEQYQYVLKYMQTVGEQDFQMAKLILKQHNFNLNAAINAKFGSHHIPNQRQMHRENNNNEEEDQQTLRRFIDHIQKQQQKQNIFVNIFDFCKGLTFGIFKFALEIFFPQFALRKFLRSKFYVIYKDIIKISFNDDQLHRQLMNTKDKSYKSCFLVISPNRKSQTIVNLLNQDQIVKKINQDFFFIGFVQGDKQLKQIDNQRPPEIIICRYNVYRQTIILKRFSGQDQIKQINVGRLNTIIQESRNHYKRDKNILIKYRNFIRRNMYGPMYMEQEQQEQINFVSRQNTSHQIRKQNQEYKKIQQEEIKRIQQMRKQEQIKMKEIEQKQMIQELRKIRKMSIPDQPSQGQKIRFIFRCPDGSSKSRTFLNDQKIQLIYNWVETNDQIEFEDSQKRNFQILYGYPPSPLTEMKQKLLKQVFESQQQKLLIRQI